MKISEIAQILGKKFIGIDQEIKGVSTLKAAIENEITFLANPKYISQLEGTKAGVVLLKEEFASRVPTAIISETPYEDFAKVASFFVKEQGFYKGISPLAYIHETAEIGSNCTVYPFATIGENACIKDNCVIFSHVYIGEDVFIGENTVIYPHVVVMGKVEIGKNCCLQPGVILGGEGFGFVRVGKNIQKIPQIGTVKLGDNVEIGANSCVDRAALAATKIGNGTCLDNLIQIGHNCEIGDNCLIVSQVGMAGSTIMEDNVTVAAQSGIGGHLHIGANSTIGPRSGVTKSVAPNIVTGGMPAVDQHTYMRTLALMPKFPELFKRVSKLEKKLEEMGE